MCDFVSWIEYEGKNYFLTNKHLEDKEGQELIRFLGPEFDEDIKGHGAIRAYYNGGKQQFKEGLKWGTEKENSDLSSPANFPPEIVESIKKGKMSH